MKQHHVHRFIDILGSGLIFAGTGICLLVILMNNFFIHNNLQSTANQPDQILNLDAQEDTWTFVAAGDIMLSRYVATIMEKEGSVHYPFNDVRSIINGADLAFANLENPVGPGPRMPTTGLRFRADPSTLEGLVGAGFDIVSLANNHQSDAGQGHIPETKRLIEEKGIRTVGAGKDEAEARAAVMMEVDGTRVAFLAYGDPRFRNQVHFASEAKPGIALADVESMKADIAAAKEVADMVIVSLHAGVEYRETPDRIAQELLDAIADAGADIVLGHHPHVIQPLYKRGNAWVIGSMGNLVFDQDWSVETQRGVMLKFTMVKNQIRGIEAIPVRIANYAQPRLIADTKEREQVLKRLQHFYIDDGIGATMQMHDVIVGE